MVDNLAPDVQQETNTTFLEERAIIKETTFPSAKMVMPSQIEKEMSESHWQARQQLSKPMQLSQTSWTTTQAPGTNIVSFSFPQILATLDSVISRTLQMYAFYKMSPIFRFQLNATQFHQGQLIVSFDPFRQSRDNNADPTIPLSVVPLFNRYYATGLPSVKIMASESDPVELKIPFIHPRNFLTTNSQSPEVYNVLGQIRVTVLNQLQVAEGSSTTLTLTTWVYASDASVHVPISYHPIAVEPTSAISSLFSNGSNLIGNVLSGNVGPALRSGQGIVDDLGQMFGFDYPNAPVAPSNTIKPVETLANGRGMTRSERLSLDPVSGHRLSSQETMTTTSEMDILQIAKTPMLLAQARFKSTQATADRLATIPVSPNTHAITDSTVGTSPCVQPSYLAFVSNFFSFWSGSIQYEFEFVATRFHSGKLLVAYCPSYCNPANITYTEAANSHPSAILDIQQTSKVSFTVPFQSATPMKTVAFGTNDDSTLGWIIVFVQNQLAHASNVAPQIDLNIYVRAGDDFSLAVPRKPEDINFEAPAVPARFIKGATPKLQQKKTVIWRIQPKKNKYLYNPKTKAKIPVDPSSTIIEATSDISFQTSRTGQEDNTTDAILSMGQSYGVSRPRFGETYTLIDTLRRFTALYDTSTLSKGADIVVHPVLSGVASANVADPAGVVTRVNYIPLKSYLSYFGKIFSAWSGSIRYKILTTQPRSSTNHLSIYHIPDYAFSYKLKTGTESDMAGYASATTDLSQNTSLEIEIPFYSPFNFLLTSPTASSIGFVPTIRDNKNYYNYAAHPVTNGLLQFLATDNIPNTRIYTAAGEDFQYFYMRSPPPLYGFNFNTPDIPQ